MEMIFNSHANKTNFYKKGCALGLVLKMRQCFRNSEVAYSTKLLKKNKTLLIRFTMIIADRYRIKFIAIFLVNLMTATLNKILYWYLFQKKLSLNTCKYPCSENIV